MRIYRYWALGKGKVTIDQEDKEVTCYGGSNISEADALVQARDKIEKIKRRIQGDPHAFDEYEAEIREEIVRVIDDKAIVTRNRYGAQVLNVHDLMILDIDRPRFSFWALFRKPGKGKDRIVGMVRQLAQKAAYQGYSFRVYETCKGIRVIVLGKAHDPAAAATAAMMKEFNCDRLYTLLCRKQGCFRARLTPKPSRMKLRGYRVRFPRENEDESEFRTWLLEYEAKSRNFSVCRFLEQIGAGTLTDVVRLHDEITGANRSGRLA